MQFHHAGIATADADALANLFCDLLGAEIVHEEVFGDLAVTFLDLGNGYFELLEPVDEGTIASYLDSHGPGIHHIAIETDDIEAAVAFPHPKSTGGVLVEFIQH